MEMVELLERVNPETEVILALSIILFSGFIMTRLTNTLNMPKVSGYILAGILIGPYCLNFIPGHIIEDMGFISDVALAFIAFGVGKFFKKEVLMHTGKKIIVITVSEALMAGVLVTLVLKAVFRLDWGFALILGAIATATAPASTMMTINQYKAKGEFVNTLLQIVALDDVVCLLAFSVVSAVINGLESGNLSMHDILIPVGYNIMAIALGVFCGYFLSRLLVPTRSRDNRLILAIAMLMGLTGLCAAVDISPLLSCMVFGAVYINLTRDKKLFRQINNFTPPVMSLFFVVSGMNLNLHALTTVGSIGVCYFIIRIVGKYLGTYLSCAAMKTSREIRNFMGFALIPQAGVAIGLAFLGQRVLPEATGNLMLTIILSSSVLYEMVGPISAKAALFLSGSIPGGAVRMGQLVTADGRIVEVPLGEESDEGAGGSEDHEEILGEKPDEEAGGPEDREGSREERPDGGTGGLEDREGSRKERPDGEAGELEDREGAENEGAGGTEDREGILGEKPDDDAGEPEDREGPEAEGVGGLDGSGEPGGGVGKGTPEENDKSGGGVGALAGGADSDGNALKSQGAVEASSIQPKTIKHKSHHKKKAPKVKDISTDPEENLTVGLPELMEYNKGVDERDDYDVEKMPKLPKPKKKKKKK